MSRHLFAELRRRNVIRAAILYVGAVWALTQGVAQLAPVVGAPEWAARWFLVAAVIAFPFWLAFAWIYEFTPDGLKRESEVDPADSIARRTGRKFDVAIIGVLALAVVLLLTDRLVLRHGVNQATSEIVAAIPEKSIAVLPFADMSQAKDQEYFSDGISEELLNLLAKVQGLQVTARTSSFSFKGKNSSIPEIAQSLHVAHVLEGSVRKSGDQLRITAQLIKAADDAPLWSQTYDRTFEDVFKIQDEIAADVVKNLRINLLGAAPKTRATDPRAYALLLEARQLMGRQASSEALAKANALFQQALAIDPDYAPAWNGLAINFSNQTGIGLLPTKDGYERARVAAEKALALDPDYAPAYTTRGMIKLRADNAPAEAAKDYERALALDPNSVAVLTNSAHFLTSLGRADDALALEMAAVRRDPVNATAIAGLASAQQDAGRFQEAAATFRTLLSLNPGRVGTHSGIGTVLLLAGDAAGALVEFEQESPQDMEFFRLANLSLANHALGRKADSDAALATLIAKYTHDAPYNIAYVCAFRGEIERAFEWLDKAVEYEDSGVIETHINPFFANLHSDPRWLPLLHKLGQAPEQLAKVEFKMTLPAN